MAHKEVWPLCGIKLLRSKSSILMTDTSLSIYLFNMKNIHFLFMGLYGELRVNKRMSSWDYFASVHANINMAWVVLGISIKYYILMRSLGR